MCLTPGLDISVYVVALRTCSLDPGPVLETTGRALETTGRALETTGRVLETTGRVLENATEFSCCFLAAFGSIQHHSVAVSWL